MDHPRVYYGKWNKSDRERQVPYDISYTWNLKTKTNEQISNKRIDSSTQRTGGCHRGGE